MADHSHDRPMRIRRSAERRDRLVAELRPVFGSGFDRELSDLQARGMVQFFVRFLGAPVYNQAVQAVRSALQAKLDDLEGELYEPEPE